MVSSMSAETGITLTLMPATHRDISISFIGIFDFVKPSKAQSSVTQSLKELGIEIHKIMFDCRLLRHSEKREAENYRPLSNLGDALHDVVKMWPLWLSNL